MRKLLIVMCVGSSPVLAQGLEPPQDLARPPEIHYAERADALLRAKPAQGAFIDLISLLEAKDEKGQTLSDRFPILAYKRLQLIDRVAPTIGRRQESDAFARAWLKAHADVMFHWDPGGMWSLSATPLFRLVDANPTAPWAEEATWLAANLIPGGDECDADCFLAWIFDRPAQYWSRFPNGKHAMNALAKGDTLVKRAIKYVGDGPPTQAMIDSVRISLTRVAPDKKARLLAQLTELQKHVKK
jgi:hypothetical protein